MHAHIYIYTHTNTSTHTHTDASCHPGASMQCLTSSRRQHAMSEHKFASGYKLYDVHKHGYNFVPGMLGGGISRTMSMARHGALQAHQILHACMHALHTLTSVAVWKVAWKRAALLSSARFSISVKGRKNSFSGKAKVARSSGDSLRRAPSLSCAHA